MCVGEEQSRPPGGDTGEPTDRRACRALSAVRPGVCVCQGVTVGRASTSALQREPDFRAALKGTALRQLLDGCPPAPGPEKASRKQPGKTGLACVFTSRPAGCPHSAGEDTALAWPGSGRGPVQGAPALPALHSTRVLSEGARGHGSLSARRSSRLLLKGMNRSRFSSDPDSAVPERSWDTGPSAVPSVGWAQPPTSLVGLSSFTQTLSSKYMFSGGHYSMRWAFCIEQKTAKSFSRAA